MRSARVLEDKLCEYTHFLAAEGEGEKNGVEREERTTGFVRLVVIHT